MIETIKAFVVYLRQEYRHRRLLVEDLLKDRT